MGFRIRAIVKCNEKGCANEGEVEFNHHQLGKFIEGSNWNQPLPEGWVGNGNGTTHCPEHS